MSSKTGKLIRWTDAEKEKMLGLLRTMAPKHPGEPLVNLLMKAQEQLPPDRRRRKESMPTVPPWIRKHFGGTKAPMNPSPREGVPSSALSPTGEGNGHAQPSTMDLLAEMPLADLQAYYYSRGGKDAEVAPQLSFEDLAYTTPLPELARVYHQRVQQEADTTLTITRETQVMLRALTAFVRGLTGSGQALKDHTRDNLPLIVITGLIQDEATKVAARFDNLVKFVFFEKDRAPSDLNNLEGTADCFVFMEKYLTRKWRAAFGGHPKARFVEGSLMGLYDLLTVLINGLAKK